MTNLKKLSNEDLIIYTCICYDEYEHANKKNFYEYKEKVKRFAAAKEELNRRLGK